MWETLEVVPGSGLSAVQVGVLKRVFLLNINNMKIEFINVGAGDAIYIETPNGTDILIDSGTVENGQKVVNYLLKQEKNMDLEYLMI